jgi:DNA-binding NarL/FixJ family response regulator
MTKVIVVDDHELMRLGVVTAIKTRHAARLCVVGEAGNGEELFAILDEVTPDIILLDIELPGMGGIDIARRLKSERPEIKILAFSHVTDTDVLQSMLETGIEGFIGKSDGKLSNIGEAIQHVMQGVAYFGKDVAQILYPIYVAKKQTTEVTSEFTPQEKRIIELCRDGLLGKEIADQLEISLRTVDKHKSNIYRKLGINTMTEMLRCAIKNGIIQ